MQSVWASWAAGGLGTGPSESAAHPASPPCSALLAGSGGVTFPGSCAHIAELEQQIPYTCLRSGQQHWGPVPRLPRGPRPGQTKPRGAQGRPQWSGRVESRPLLCAGFEMWGGSPCPRSPDNWRVENRSPLRGLAVRTEGRQQVLLQKVLCTHKPSHGCEEGWGRRTDGPATPPHGRAPGLEGPQPSLAMALTPQRKHCVSWPFVGRQELPARHPENIGPSPQPGRGPPPARCPEPVPRGHPFTCTPFLRASGLVPVGSWSAPPPASVSIVNACTATPQAGSQPPASAPAAPLSSPCPVYVPCSPRSPWKCPLVSWLSLCLSANRHP